MGLEVKILRSQRESIVQTIKIVAIPFATNPPRPSGKMLVHWQLNACIDNIVNDVPAGRASIIFDTSKTPDDIIDVNVRFSKLEQSKRAIAAIPIQPSMNFTIQNIIDHIENAGRDKYQFDVNRSGCLYWCRTLMADFEQKGWVASTWKPTLDAWVNWARALPQYEVPDDHGVFYG